MSMHRVCRGAAAGFLMGMAFAFPAGAANDGNPPPVPARIVLVQAATVPIYAEVPGTVVAARRVRIASRISGFVQSISVHEGDRVRAGQLLLMIDPSDLEGRLREARAALASARAAYAEAAANYARYGKLFAAGAVSRQEYEQITRVYRDAQARRERARAGVHTAQAAFAYAKIDAPLSGVVTERRVQAGDLTSPGQPLLSIDDPSVLEVALQVDATEFAHLPPGERVSVRVAHERISATVLRRVPAADSRSHTRLVKLALPPSSAAGIGDYARVQVPVGSHRAIVVPVDAVVERAGIRGVFVVDHDGVAQLRLVRTGPVTPQGIEVSAGLEAGERIVAAPTAQIENGTRVGAEGGRGQL